MVCLPITRQRASWLLPNVSITNKAALNLLVRLCTGCPQWDGNPVNSVQAQVRSKTQRMGSRNLPHGCLRNRRWVNSVQNAVQLLIPETVGITVFLVKKVTLTFLDDISPECLETVVPRESTFSGQMVWKCESVEFSRQHHAETKGV